MRAGYDGRVRLAAKTKIGDTAVLGRPEVISGGGWKIPCSGVFDTENAAVVCRQLGYQGGGVILPAPGPVLPNIKLIPTGFDRLNCNGDESEIAACALLAPEYSSSNGCYDNFGSSGKVNVISLCSSVSAEGARVLPC